MNQKDNSSVIDAEFDFALKSALDGAEKNLGHIMSSIRKQSADVDHGNCTENLREFVHSFIEGSGRPFYEPLEDSDVLYKLLESDKDHYGKIMGITLKYSYAKNATLALALADAFGQRDSIMQFLDRKGVPFHCAVINLDQGLALDANGIHEVKDMIKRLQGRLLGGPVTMQLVSWDSLAAITNSDQHEFTQAINEYSYVSRYMLENMDALVEIPDFSDDLIDEFEP